jgi:SAM-dependent methyltransferase
MVQVSWRRYDRQRARAFEEERAGPDEWFGEVRALLAQEMGGSLGLPVLDLGAGTGLWSDRLSRWLGATVVAVDPSLAMLEVAGEKGLAQIRLTAGRAERIPLRDASCGGAWLSTVVHQFDDLAVAAHELRRVVTPGGVVLVRAAFPDRGAGGIVLTRFFPTASRIVREHPTVAETCRRFASVGLGLRLDASVTEVTASSRRTYVDRLGKRADSVLRRVPDAEFRRGVDGARRWAEEHPAEPVLFRPTVLVFS